jgi:drug/metabolite transporter (DMT)-like permease
VLFLSEPMTVKTVIGGCLVLSALIIIARYDRGPA